MSAAAENPRAIALMTLGMAGFALEDFLIKRVAAELPTAQILLVLSVGGALLFAALCRARGLPLFTGDLRNPLVAIRNIAEGVTSLCFVTALTLIPLSLVASILQATPLLVTAGAALWLGERVGWRRWTAVLTGLLGVLLILRPGVEGFRPAALLVVLTVVGLAARDLASRRIPARISTHQLAFWAYLSIAGASAALFVAHPRLSAGTPGTWIDLFLAIGVGVVAYGALTAATRIGDISAVVPFRYTRLVFAMILGMAFLGERPDWTTLTGAAVVVGSGLYAWARERRAWVSPPVASR